MHTSHPRLAGELTFMVLLVLVSVFLLWTSYQISSLDSLAAPGSFPMVCAFAMLVTGLINAVKTARARLNLENGETRLQQFGRKVTPVQLIAFTVLIFLYMLGMEYIGFLLASYLFLAMSMYLLGSRRVLLNLTISLLVLVAIFVVFRTAFSVVLPAGSLVGPHLPGFLR
ncbi:MAG: tripartite tricarboxylate transporter TctB family protein [Hydrogenophaga sp.]|uniref:tripartite tricarboxylate transporter TctB family protein n=1 Tax=Hydrogenophaga sp. TaxID=1904254 RepID=UPI00271F9C85|nr:tripartite tricarboxylate transporter TctB family protein [Hydrogenophaga sp.]MDO9146817.1 tripartite tricarboxylate transporter TctB family protein [Hydrogenophaga sp.]MDO9605752.1 tripartite tricarboxylate transporter TctB family protein [Hydrogenophaga sp.]